MHDAFTPAKTVTYMVLYRSTNSQTHIPTLTHTYPHSHTHMATTDRYTYTHACYILLRRRCVGPVVIATG